MGCPDPSIPPLPRANLDEYPWTPVYLSALAEFDEAKHLEAIDAALAALGERLDLLPSGGGKERTAIADATNALTDLRRQALAKKSSAEEG